ncbi:Galactose mutarotase-like superfamily protein [Actinidia rufa]|uniref:Galactose mutarotase-like superfamily protein n=1 Tax=Actinidia rufa TaxID=165716 RepID=A0A7J0FY24_9ERIC|nr:Galactose mutarotase-like superfamily protein [Actinidia rufa]
MADSEQKKPELFELNNGTMQVKVSNYGCTITSLSVPGKDGWYRFVSLFHQPVSSVYAD